MFISKAEKMRIDTALRYLLDRERARDYYAKQLAELERRITDLENCYTAPKPEARPLLAIAEPKPEEKPDPVYKNPAHPIPRKAGTVTKKDLQDYEIWKEVNRDLIKQYRKNSCEPKGPIEEGDWIMSYNIEGLLDNHPHVKRFYELCPGSSPGRHYWYISTTISTLSISMSPRIRSKRASKFRLLYSKSDTEKFLVYANKFLAVRVYFGEAYAEKLLEG